MNNAEETIIYKLTYNESYFGENDAKVFVYYFKSAIQLVNTIPTIMNVMQDRNEDNFNVQEVRFYPGKTKWYTLEKWMEKDIINLTSPELEIDNDIVEDIKLQYTVKEGNKYD